jgi:hypothetical protein
MVLCGSGCIRATGRRNLGIRGSRIRSDRVLAVDLTILVDRIARDFNLFPARETVSIVHSDDGGYALLYGCNQITATEERSR